MAKEEEAEAPSLVKTGLLAIVWIVISIACPFLAMSAYSEAAGDWMAIIGRGEYRDPRLPMRFVFGMWWFLFVPSTFFAVCGVLLTIRIVRGRCPR